MIVCVHVSLSATMAPSSSGSGYLVLIQKIAGSNPAGVTKSGIIKRMKKYASWLAGLAILTIIFGTIYVVAQQSLRQGANDPQVQLAQDVANQLNEGTFPFPVSNGHVDIAVSLAPFIVVYDKTGKPIQGTGYLEGQLPTIPKGVLDHANSNYGNRVTWQPQPGVRIATVTVAAKDYYVMSGRNLREVEKREDQALQLSVLGWLASLVVVVTACWYRNQRTSLKKN